MDMKFRFYVRLSLLTVFLASCASGTATVSPEPLATTVIESTATAPEPSQPPTEAVSALPTETLAPTALPVATSRGPNLEATDPTTVKLASGQLQFVEFFRFT
ncbi:MAG: hypothetical protein QM730_26245 [Anaerolineales bacterium]